MATRFHCRRQTERRRRPWRRLAGIVLGLLMGILLPLARATAAGDAPGNLDLASVGQYGGAARGLAVEGSLAALGVGPRLLLLDLAAQGAPSVRGETALPGVVESIALSGGLAYVAAGANLCVVDVQDPARPLLVGACPLPDRAHTVCLAGGRAYVAAGNAGLRIVDVGDPQHPVEAGAYATLEPLYAVAVAGSYACVPGTNNLKVVDVANAADPWLAGSVQGTWREPRAVCVSGHLAYVACNGDYGATLAVIDIANPADPQPVKDWRNWSLDNAPALGIQVVNDMAYVTTGGAFAGLYTVYLGDQWGPYGLGQFLTTGAAYGVYVGGNRAYVADSAWGLRMVNVADPRSLQDAGGCRVANPVRAVDVAGRYACLALEHGGLAIVDLQNLARPAQAGIWTGNDVSCVRVRGSYAYMAGAQGLQVLDISDPAHPSVAGQCGAPYFEVAYDVEIVGSLAYVAAGPRGLHIVDISNPQQPHELGSLTALGGDSTAAGRGIGNTAVSAVPPMPTEVPHIHAQGIEISGSLAYVVGDDYSMRIVDIANPAQPRLVGSCATDYPLGFAVAGSYAYVAAAQQGLQIVDVSDPGRPTVVAGYSASRRVRTVVATGALIFAGTDGGEILALDATDPAHLQQIGHLATGGTVSQVTVAGNLLYIADGEGGLLILRAMDEHWRGYLPLARSSGSAGSSQNLWGSSIGWGAPAMIGRSR